MLATTVPETAAFGECRRRRAPVRAPAPAVADAVRSSAVTASDAGMTRRGRGTELRSRLVAVIVALAVLAGGCGGARTYPDDVVTRETKAPTTATTTPPAAASGTVAPPTTAAASSATTGPTLRPSTTRRPATTRAPAPTVNAGDQAIVRAARGPSGAAAGIILQPAPATSLVVEVLEEPGAAANRIALNRVLSDLRKYTGKSVSEVRTALPAGSAGKRWDEAQLEALIDRSAKVAQGGGRFVLRLAFVKGQNVRSPNILAESFRGDIVVGFPDRYASSGQHIITAVTVHEVGHLLGLVDLYLERGRADTRNDPAGGGHSRNPASVMYFAVDPSVLGALFGTSSDRFDAQDERDLAAIRRGAAPGSNPP